MTTLSEIRQKYPQYADLSDDALARGLHSKFYSDLDFGEFSQKIGYSSAPSPSRLMQVDPAEYDPASPQFQGRYGPTMSGASRAPVPTFQGGTQAEHQQFTEQMKGHQTPLLTSGGEFTDYLAGIGKQFTDMLLGGRQIAGRASFEDATTKRELDAPLAATTAGKAGQVTGGVAAALPASMVPGVNTVLGGAALGGTLGALQPTEKPWDRAINTGTGAVLGGATNYVGNRIARGATAGQTRAPTIDELKAAKDAAYKAAEGGDDIITSESLSPAVTRAERMLAEEGYRPGLHPATKEALDALYEDTTRPHVVGQSLKGVEGLRRQLVQAETTAFNRGDRSDARLAGKVLDEFDEVFEAAAPAASERYATARELFNRLRKAQDIEALVTKAENAAGGLNQSGFDNALRIQFRQLADNPKRFSRFTKVEQEEILKVVRGGPLQSAIRFLGRFAARGPVSAMATGLLGNAFGGPGGVVALGAVGEGSRALAGSMRSGAVNNVSELVRRGARPPLVGNGPIAQTGYLPPLAIGSQVATQQAIAEDPNSQQSFLNFLLNGRK